MIDTHQSDDLSAICYAVLEELVKITNNCKTFFEPIKYNLGKQKNKIEKIDKIKSNIFWGVIVAIIVGTITTIICNAILK